MLKEAKTLSGAGHDVTVIWCPISPWADDFDESLFKKYDSIKWIQAGYHHKKQKYKYWYARLRQKIWQLIYVIVHDKFDAGIKSIVLFSQELKNKALENRADLFIGHNIGALTAIVMASKKFKAKSIFDFEDFHRGESKPFELNYKIVSEIEEKYVNDIDCFTAASPGISEVYKELFPSIDIVNIYNVFSLDYSISGLIDIPHYPLKLFWFSQYIGKKRGLETILHAISKLPPNSVTITLLGYANEDIKNYFFNITRNLGISKRQLIFIGSVPENEIFKIASLHHIGIASEIKQTKNRDLCLTNKIFVYLMSGCSLLMSDTGAQYNFWSNNKLVGSIYNQDNIDELAHILLNYIEQPDILKSQRLSALSAANSKYNWESEQSKILFLLDKILHNII
jgi:glycosyltransferase involved in cell wall biosynthesis